MLIELLREIILEIIRALFLEELCRRVRERITERTRRQRVRRYQVLLHRFHVRHRKRLMHRLTTGGGGNL